MDRRKFLGSILGTAAATALPSEIWPFRKIFLPPTDITTSFYQECGRLWWNRPGGFKLENIRALELETFARGLPLLFPAKPHFDLFKKREPTIVLA